MITRIARRNRRALPAQQRGIALLVALLAVALSLILIAGLLERGELAFARTRNALRGEQANAYADGLEAYAARVLERDLDQNANLDANGEIWASPLPPQEVPGGTISARMIDLDGRFNLNNLRPGATGQDIWFTRFQRLLKARSLNPALADAVVDWLDIDFDVKGSGGAEDSSYLAQPIPYRAGNRLFAHVSELRLVRGFDGDAYAQLAPFVAALPPGTILNLNTASVPVLMSLDDAITQSVAEGLWQNGQARWGGPDQFGLDLANRLASGKPWPADPTLGVTSKYFVARGDIVLDGLPLTFLSLLKREQGQGVIVLARSRGSDELVGPTMSDAALAALRNVSK